MGRRDELQPQVILLESQLKAHHLLHWSWPGPPASATFKVRHSYAGQCMLCNKNPNFRNSQDMIQNQNYHKLISMIVLIRSSCG